MTVVMEQASQVQGSVAEVMAGMEGVKEGVSERNREDKRGGMGAGTITQGDDDQAVAQIKSGLTRRALPTQEIMIKKIRTAINDQIKAEMKKAASLKKNLTTGGAQEYNASIARIRSLQQVLKSLFHNTLERVKELYFRYFGEDGRRKNADF